VRPFEAANTLSNDGMEAGENRKDAPRKVVRLA
jgi:hypothetical protein